MRRRRTPTVAVVATVAVLVAGGATGGCRGPDTDGDRLPDAVETGTGHYRGPGDTGTSPTSADTDRDGLFDGDEVLGTTDGLALPAMGADPNRRTILLEYDWFGPDHLECAEHSHAPPVAALDRVTAMFAAAPIQNPDGSTGIDVVHDHGQGGAFTGGGEVADTDGDGMVAEDMVDDFRTIKARSFAANRTGRFHWVLLPHFYGDRFVGGAGDLGGDDIVLAQRCWPQDVSDLANGIMHELGHNLGLEHGSRAFGSFEPNYNSMMNTRYAYDGVDADCDGKGDGTLTYSRGTNPPLDERALSEAKGICGGVPIDWNGNGRIDPGTVAADIDRNWEGQADGVLQVLRDVDDWARVRAMLPRLPELGD